MRTLKSTIVMGYGKGTTCNNKQAVRDTVALLTVCSH
jgi:hypothetical protein